MLQSQSILPAQHLSLGQLRGRPKGACCQSQQRSKLPLCAAGIIYLAKKQGVDAIHPGEQQQDNTRQMRAAEA